MAYQHRGGEMVVNTTTQGAQYSSTITTLASGFYLVVWHEDPLGSRGQVFDADGNRVGADFPTSAWRVAALPGGGFVAVWGDSQDVFAQIHDAAGATVGSPFLVNTTIGNQYPESVAALASGEFVITWGDSSTLGNLDVRGQRFGADGTRLGAEFVVNAEAVGTGYQLNSEVKGLAGGGFVVAWESEGDIKAQIFSSAGARAGGEFRVNGTTGKMAVPQIAALASGGFAIVWTEDTQLSGPEPHRGVYARIFSASGVPVGTDRLIAPEGPQDFTGLDVAPLATGGFVTTWATSFGAAGDGSGMTVKAQVLDHVGNEVGGELIVNSTAHGDQMAPVVTGLPSGDFVIAWTDGSESGGTADSLDIRSQLFQWDAPIEGPYQPRGGEILVNTQTEWAQLAPKMTELASGGYVILWLDFTGDNRGQVFDASGHKVGAEFVTRGWDAAALPGGGFVTIWFDDNEVRAQRYDATGATVGPSFLANTTTDGNQNANSVASLASGEFVITWTDHRIAGDADVLGQRFSAEGAKLGPEFVVGTDSPAIADQVGSRVMGLAGGGFVIAWQQGSGIRAQVYDAAGSKVGAEFPVNSRTSQVEDPRIAALASGGFVIVWPRNVTLSGERDTGIHGQIFDSSGARIGSEFTVSSETPEIYGSPDVAGLATGGFIVTWASASGDGSGQAVKAQAYDDLGNRVGVELLANTTTAGNQHQPSVIGLPSGDFVISWTDNSQTGGDTSEAAIRSQLFHAVAPIEGSYRDEYLTGTALNDELFGYGGDDELRGLAGNDLLDGGDGNDIVRGGAGDDLLKLAGLGDDLAAGGAGFDTLVADFSESWTEVISSWGPIANSSQGGFDGGFRDDGWRWVNYTSIERFIVTGGIADDHLVTADGDDSIDGGPGDDVMAGGPGDDVYHVDSICDLVVEQAGAGKEDEVRTGLGTYVLAANVDYLTATNDVAHDFRGNSSDNRITGGAGNDVFRLQDGGLDRLLGGAGNDFFYFGAALDGSDQADGGDGADQLALQGNYDLTFSRYIIGIESIVLLPGSDTRFGDPGTSNYDYDLTVTDANVAAGRRLTVDANRLRAGEDFAFDGSAERDGTFFLVAGHGVDRLTGGSQSDTFLFGENGQFGASDVVNGGSGGSNDQLALRGNYTITFGAGQLVSIESISLVSAQDTRFGPLGSVHNYNLTMNDGNVAAGQLFTVDGAPLRPNESLTFHGAAEVDGSFRVAGGAGGDTITGGSQGDILIGRGGADAMTGGGGNDQFRYNEAADSTAAVRDTILDFTTGDVIDLSRIDAIAGTPANDAFAFIGSAAFTNVAGQLRAYQSGAHWLVEGDVNGDGAADLVIQLTLTGPGPLVAGDFIL